MILREIAILVILILMGWALKDYHREHRVGTEGTEKSLMFGIV